MGHRALRVINEDMVIPGAGFGDHSHAEMDIITYVIAGSLRHGDSMGNSTVIGAGEFQHMYAGTGVTHNEMNASNSEKVHFLQIWVIPERIGGEPSYFQIKADLDSRRNQFIQVAGPDEREDQARLRSDTKVFMMSLEEGRSIHHEFEPGRAGFLQLVNGMIDIDGQEMRAGDGLQIEARSSCTIVAKNAVELMLFDLS